LTDEQLLTTEQAADELRMSPLTLTCWRSLGSQPGLRFVRVGRSVRYRRADIRAWLESRLNAPDRTDPPGGPERGR
jgi:excisionase family DNA binding protein